MIQNFAFGVAVGAAIACIVLVPLAQKYHGLWLDAEERIDNLLEFDEEEIDAALWEAGNRYKVRP